VRLAKVLSQWPAASGKNKIARIIITDDGDCTCFEWKAGEGVTFK
jgi:hypothetical protein